MLSSSLKSFLRRHPSPALTFPWWLPLLALILALVQCYTAWGAPGTATQSFYEHVGLTKVGIIEGRLWTLLTHALFHHPLQWSHLILNLLTLIYLTGRLSHILTPQACLKILLYGILAGGLLYLLISLFTESSLPLIGLSGGLFCLLSVLCHLAPHTRFWPLGISGKNLVKALVLTSIFFLLTSPSLQLPFLSPIGHKIASTPLGTVFQIGHSCHLGGLIAGWFYALKLLRIPKRLKNHKSLQIKL